MNIGIQLYSAKAKIEEIGLDAVLANLSAIGVDTVETAGFYGLSPAELKEKLDQFLAEKYADGTLARLAAKYESVVVNEEAFQ